MVRTNNPPKVSIVIPVYNEEEGINVLFDRVISSISKIDQDFEVIIVNDGSHDSSLSLLLECHKKDPRFKIVSLSRNFGHQCAILAGLTVSQGEFIGIMDGDLQDPPELFEKFMETLSSGYDVVYAVRKNRKEGIIKKFAYWLYYRFFHKISEGNIPLDSGDFCMVRRNVLDEMLKMPEQGLYLRGIRSWVGFKQTKYEYDRDERKLGSPKYNFRQLMNLAYNGIFSFSNVPIKIIRRIGYITIFLCFAYAIKVLISYFIYNTAPQGFTTLALAIFFIGGIQLVFMGVLGEYIHRTYSESRQRPLFIIDKFYSS